MYLKWKGGNFVIADRKKLEMAMARACMNTDDLQRTANMPRPTINNIVTGRNVRPGTIGKVARALQVDVSEILKEEEEP